MNILLTGNKRHKILGRTSLICIICTSIVTLLFVTIGTTKVLSNIINVEEVISKASDTKKQLESIRLNASDLELKNRELELIIAQLEGDIEVTAATLTESTETVSELQSYIEELEQKEADLDLENAALKEYYFRTTGLEVEEIRQVDIEATMYTNAEGWFDRDDPNYGMTASGAFTSDGVAAAPAGIPFRTNVMLDGYSDILSVQDRGSAIIEDDEGEICIDIWTEESNLSGAYEFGRQHLEGFIIIPKEEDQSYE